MENYKTDHASHFSCVLVKYSVLLNFSLLELQEHFIDYPLSVMEHMEKDIIKKSIQIRLDEDDMTITCTFNDWGKCDGVVMHPDKREWTEGFVEYLRERYGDSEIEGGFDTEFSVVEIVSEDCILIYE